MRFRRREKCFAVWDLFARAKGKKKRRQKKFGFMAMVTKKAIKGILLEFNPWSMRFMLAYISRGRQGSAAGVLWGNARHHNGTCAHKVITYHPRRAQKRRGLQSLSCSSTAARAGG